MPDPTHIRHCDLIAALDLLGIRGPESIARIIMDAHTVMVVRHGHSGGGMVYDPETDGPMTVTSRIEIA